MVADAIDELSAQWRMERPDLDPGALDSAATLNRLVRFLSHVGSVLESELAAYGLKIGEFDLLSALRRSGVPFQQTPAQLIRNLWLSSGAMTNRIDRLEALGYVERQPDPDDGRSVIVCLTPSGREVVDRAIETHTAAEHELMSALSARERAQLDRIARSLLASVPTERPRSS